MARPDCRPSSPRSRCGAGGSGCRTARPRRQRGSALRASRLAAAPRQALGRGVLAAWALGWPLLALLLDRATDTDVPWFDAFPTVGSVIGQVLLGRKYLENWPVWVLVNLVSVALFAFKGLWLPRCCTRCSWRSRCSAGCAGTGSRFAGARA